MSQLSMFEVDSKPASTKKNSKGITAASNAIGLSDFLAPTGDDLLDRLNGAARVCQDGDRWLLHHGIYEIEVSADIVETYGLVPSFGEWCLPRWHRIAELSNKPRKPQKIEDDYSEADDTEQY